MSYAPKTHQMKGLSLIELMVATLVFVLVCGAGFVLVTDTQRRYQTETQVLDAFQEARFGIDLIVRDMNDSGYPPPGNFTFTPRADLYASTPIAWAPNYPGTPCAISVNCMTPSDFDLIVETSIDPQNNPGVQWIRYRLIGYTLYRGVANKVPGADPDATTEAVLVPYVQNVLNDAPLSQIAQLRGAYPSLYPGGAPVPVFNYFCDASTGLMPCSLAGPDNSPSKIRDVEITLIVMGAVRDMQTGQPRLVELHGRGHRINPNP